MRNPIEDVLDTLMTQVTTARADLRIQVVSYLRALSSSEPIHFLPRPDRAAIMGALIQHGYLQLPDQLIVMADTVRLQVCLTENGMCLVHNLNSGMYS